MDDIDFEPTEANSGEDVDALISSEGEEDVHDDDGLRGGGEEPSECTARMDDHADIPFFRKLIMEVLISFLIVMSYIIIPSGIPRSQSWCMA